MDVKSFVTKPKNACTKFSLDYRSSFGINLLLGSSTKLYMFLFLSYMFSLFNLKSNPRPTLDPKLNMRPPYFLQFSTGLGEWPHLVYTVDHCKL